MFILCISQIMTSMSKRIEFVVSLKIKDKNLFPANVDINGLHCINGSHNGEHNLYSTFSTKLQAL